MALTLAQAAVLSQNQLSRSVMETFVIESSVLDRIPFMEIEGNAFAYNRELALPGVAFRGVNEAYVESTGTFSQLTETLCILGGDADVDRFIQLTRSDLYDQRAMQTRAKVKAMSYKFQDTFINGSVAVDSKSFDGLKTRLTGAQVISAGTNGIPVVGNGDSDASTFFDKLDDLIGAVSGGPDVLYTNAAIKSKIVSASRRKTGDAGYQQDINGKRNPTWNGVPIVDIGNTAAGAAIIPQTETQGSSSVAGSIYAVKFGQNESDQAVTGLTNGGVQVMDLGQLQEKPALRTRIEAFLGMALFGGKAAARLTGVLAS